MQIQATTTREVIIESREDLWEWQGADETTEPWYTARFSTGMPFLVFANEEGDWCATTMPTEDEPSLSAALEEVATYPMTIVERVHATTVPQPLSHADYAAELATNVAAQQDQIREAMREFPPGVDGASVTARYKVGDGSARLGEACRALRLASVRFAEVGL